MNSYAEFLANRGKVNENLDPEILAEIRSISTEVKARGWKLNQKITKKSQAQIEALGLDDYLRGGDRYQEIINAVIDAATDAGGKRIFDRGAGDAGDDSAVWYTEPSKLYTLLNPVEEAELVGDSEFEEIGGNNSLFDSIYALRGKYSGTVVVLSPDAKGYTAWYTKPKNNLVALMFAGAMERREFGNINDAQQWARNAARDALKSAQ